MQTTALCKRPTNLSNLGYDYSVAGTCTAFPAFVKHFGEPYEGGYLIAARIQSGWTGASTAGDVIGVIFGSYLIEITGRKHSILVGSVFTAAGVGMQQGASGW